MRGIVRATVHNVQQLSVKGKCGLTSLQTIGYLEMEIDTQAAYIPLAEEDYYILS